MIITISKLKSQLISTNKIKLVLLATPIVIGSGLCFYYYYYYLNKSSNEDKKGKRKYENELTANLTKAIELKNKGNEYFRQKNYDEALKLYTEAILLCPPDRKKEISTFYQNRAACFEHLKKYYEVINDSSKAIENEKMYIKAYLRRGKAYETLENFEDASYDYYVASKATQFQNSDYIKLLSECLSRYAYKKAQEIISKRKTCTFPRYMFKNLLLKFSRDPLRKKSDEILNNYNAIIDKLFNNDTDDNLNHDDLLLKATIELYIGRHEEGKKKLNKLIEIANVDYKVNALLKLCEYSIQHNNFEEAEKCLKDALEIDPKNADIYYFRSQLYIINRNYEESIEELKKAIELDADLVIAIGQKLNVQYQMIGDLAGKAQILKEFEEYTSRFPHNNELLLLHFQILLNDNQMKKAEELITKAIENDPEDPTLYVYKVVVFIETGEVEKTKEFLDHVLKLDPKCSFAYEILSDLSTKMDNFREALDYLDKAISNSITFEDLKNLIFKQKSLMMQLKSQLQFP